MAVPSTDTDELAKFGYDAAAIGTGGTGGTGGQA